MIVIVSVWDQVLKNRFANCIMVFKCIQIVAFVSENRKLHDSLLMAHSISHAEKA
jgi:hypothetical protein